MGDTGIFFSFFSVVDSVRHRYPCGGIVRYPVEDNVTQRYPAYVCEGRERKRKVAGQNGERLSGFGLRN